MRFDLAEASAIIDRCWRDVRVAAAFLTRLPLKPPPQPANDASEDGTPVLTPAGYLAAASAMFPVIGVVIGAGAALAMVLSSQFGLHPLACGLVAVATAAIFTGALHEDGLADFFDGLGGGHDREQRLAIMRDHRIGVFGTLALIFSIGLRATVLSQLESVTSATAALIVASVASRAALPAVMRWLKPARTQGMSYTAGQPQPTQVTIALAFTAVVALLALDFGTAIAALGAAALAAAVIAWLAVRSLGGHTGDVLGAVQQAVETLVLAAVAAAE
jgi:adenosylcobinamide-GDP ribazoletransferase